MLRPSALLLSPFLGLALLAQPTPYQKAPKAIQEVLDAAGAPILMASPTGDRFLLAESDRHPSIRDLAQPMARLAGHRINPLTRGPHSPSRLKSLSVQAMEGGSPKAVVLPTGVSLGQPRWSPDGKCFILTGVTATATELWVGDPATAKLRKIPNLKLNAVLGSPLDWLPDGTLLCKAVPPDQGPCLLYTSPSPRD